MPRYDFGIYGNERSSPSQLKETVLRIFRVNEVSRKEVDLFRLQFDTTTSVRGKLDVIKQWVTLISIEDNDNVRQ